MSVPVLVSSPSGYSQLNIQGVHSSNLTATPALSTYPTSTTSNSLGHYHFVDSTTKATNHLNVSASSTGGHIFSHVNASQAPTTVLKVDRTALTLDTLLRNSTAKTYLDMSLGELKLINDTYNNTLTQSFMLMNDVANNYTGTYTAQQVYLVDNSTSFQTRVYAGQTQISNNTTDLNDVTPTYLEISNLPLKDVKSRLTKDNLTITDISSNVSILSSTDLTFNGVSLPSTVSTLSGDISTITGDITTISGEIATINGKLPKMIVSQIQPVSTAIYADSSIAPQTSPYLNTYGYGGWAYAKASPQASNAKINWYFPFPIIGGTVGDLKGLYYQIFNGNITSSDNLPFFTVYTVPQGPSASPPDYRSWYHSSMTYVCTSTSPVNQTIQAYANIKSLPFTPQSIGIQNQLSMIQSTVNNPKGDYQDNQQILFIAFGTNSASALGSVSFSCGKIGMITEDYSSEWLLL